MDKLSPIIVRLGDPSQLFEAAGPSPFGEAGPSPDAERFFLREAKARKGQARLGIVLELPPGQTPPGLAERLRSAFTAAAGAERLAIQDLFRTGRRVLAIGLSVLAGCLLLAAQSEDLLGHGISANLLRESAVIFGWVAIWRPAEIFLYDWLPLRSRLAALRRLADAEIECRAAPAG
ncbi:hypothetical protein [Roseococcus pinisoli]|uniref:Uncharacterized protein n=1 Tax=Roseococcus pinisoli TaxID=2835040 RepID=A0ABS5QJ66_9PROT|nr:hypothetical protein [Roseococcus pinisoli]MBS7813617.1 hypothetical protein [Roseococcus pinisoli]